MRDRERFSPAQCRAGRALLDWSQDRLAMRADLELEAIELFEAATAELCEADIHRIGRAFLEAGVIALPADWAGEGVRLSRPARSTP